MKGNDFITARNLTRERKIYKRTNKHDENTEAGCLGYAVVLVITFVVTYLLFSKLLFG